MGINHIFIYFPYIIKYYLLFLLTVQNINITQACWFIPIIPALCRLRQEEL